MKKSFKHSKKKHFSSIFFLLTIKKKEYKLIFLTYLFYIRGAYDKFTKKIDINLHLFILWIKIFFNCGVLTSLLLPHLSSSLTDSLASLNLLCHSKTDAQFMQDAPKAVWSEKESKQERRNRKKNIWRW